LGKEIQILGNRGKTLSVVVAKANGCLSLQFPGVFVRGAYDGISNSLDSNPKIGVFSNIQIRLKFG